MKNHRQLIVLLTMVFIFSTALFCIHDAQAKEDSTGSSTHIQDQQKSGGSGSSHGMADRPRGYLSMDTMPDSAVLLPPPPAEGSAAMAHDMEVSKECLKLRESKRWEQAAIDAVLEFPDAFCGFSCILGIPITETDTPVLYKMLRKVAFDAGFSTFKAKMKFNRPRPFLVNNEPICTPDQLNQLQNNGSYPSGHTAVGWAWALVMAELLPKYADDIIARGRAFGESRMVCNVHWQSDVNEGRFMASATVARLHGEAEFRSDMDTARTEIESAKTKGLKPFCTCETEENDIESLEE